MKLFQTVQGAISCILLCRWEAEYHPESRAALNLHLSAGRLHGFAQREKASALYNWLNRLFPVVFDGNHDVFHILFNLTAVSNNEAWGTVAVSGNRIIATPTNGYYVESCTVLSGTATCTINGNTITVAADSDCTVQVNFAPKPTYTVNFVASGNAARKNPALLKALSMVFGIDPVLPDVTEEAACGAAIFAGGDMRL